VTLRLRLLLLVVGFVAAGLLITDVVTYHSLRSFLTTRVDQQLDVAAFPVGRALLSSSGLGPQVPAAPPTAPGLTVPSHGARTEPRRYDVVMYVVQNFAAVDISGEPMQHSLPDAGE